MFLMDYILQVRFPFLIVHGEEDKLTDPSMSKLLYSSARSLDKTLKLYPNMWHGLTNGEPLDHIELVFSDIIAWLGKRSDAGCPEDPHLETYRNSLAWKQQPDWYICEWEQNVGCQIISGVSCLQWITATIVSIIVIMGLSIEMHVCTDWSLWSKVFCGDLMYLSEETDISQLMWDLPIKCINVSLCVKSKMLSFSVKSKMSRGSLLKNLVWNIKVRGFMWKPCLEY